MGTNKRRVLVGRKRKLRTHERFHRLAYSEFRAFVRQIDFPCLGAKTALNADSYKVCSYSELGGEESSTQLATDLQSFVNAEWRLTCDYATFIAVFQTPKEQSEEGFENRLWSQLSALNQIDKHRFAWDPRVSSDPADPHFSFSFAGEAMYVIGLHEKSSRLARRFPWPALVFNPHDQFSRLRARGKWKRMQESIRARDVALQGGVNPMLSDFGDRSEARQYSGRAVDEAWRPDFVVGNPAPVQPLGRCPFGH